tara:strand:- start:203 stop:514 length:312 start_codon:yes stop_codon:yes gene_type:complete
MEHKRPTDIPGYTHPGDMTYSRANIYKTFTEGKNPTKKEKFGVTTSGNKYAKLIVEDKECPVCKEEATKICPCVYNDRTCENGHVWYTSRNDGEPTIGNPHKK